MASTLVAGATHFTAAAQTGRPVVAVKRFRGVDWPWALGRTNADVFRTDTTGFCDGDGGTRAPDLGTGDQRSEMADVRRAVEWTSRHDLRELTPSYTAETDEVQSHIVETVAVGPVSLNQSR